MADHELESAVLFTPGRASYITQEREGAPFVLNLTEASRQRGDIAAEIFDPRFHESAVFAGGYPGIAQNWPEEHIPAIGSREANLMAHPLIARLKREQYTDEAIDLLVSQQAESNNSIHDVLVSIERGFIDPNDFHQKADHGIHLVAGHLHGFRFRDILMKALDIDKHRIRRADMHDPYGTPATQFRKKEITPVALAKEYAAIGLTRMVLKDVKSGDLQSLRDAEQRFNDIATKNTK